MKSLLLIISIFLVYTGHTQQTDTVSVLVHKDPRMEELSKKQAAVNLGIKKASARTMRGFRLLILNTSNRDEAIDAKTKVLSYFPELKAYIGYQSPMFKVKAGNFKTRDEAEKYRKNLNTVFPKGVFIISETIEVKPEKDTDLKEL
jgi:hypothetical protein